MEKEKLIEIANDVENKSNKDLFEAQNLLYSEFQDTKELIIELTRHLDKIEILYNNVNDEIGKRTSKWK